MGIKLFLGICMLPVFLIMYAVVMGIEKRRSGMIFGITLWEGAEQQEEVKQLQKSYKKSMKKNMALMMGLFLLCFLPKHFSIFLTLQIIWVFLMIVIPFIPYAKANGRMRELKQEYRAAAGLEKNNGEAWTVYVDVTAAATEKPLYFMKSTLAAVVVSLLPPAAEILLVKMNVWYNPAAPELWLSQLLLLSFSGVTLIFFLCLFYYRSMATRAVSGNSQLNIQIARVKQYQWSRFMAIAAWLTAVYNCIWLVFLHIDSKIMILLPLLAAIPYGAFLMWGMWKCWKNIRSAMEKYVSQENIQLEEEENYWLWGLVYYNKNDNRFWVEQRVGTGFTTNMAKPFARAVSIMVMTVTVVFLIGMCAWIITEDFTPVSLTYQNQELSANHWKEVYTIPCSDMESVELWEEKPRMSKRMGTGMDTVQKGDFFSREYERSFEVCLNPQAGPYLMVKTKDGTWYLLGNETGEEIPKIYDQIKKDLENK